MKRGDIYLVALDPAQGRDQKGYRPVLVVSADAFNQATKLPVILPITTGGNLRNASALRFKFLVSKRPE